MNLAVAVFSYNRGNYVKNCLDSLQHCLPNAALRVFDDDSTDKDTVEYLQSINAYVANCAADKFNGNGSNRHGGLYHNMQRALDWAPAEYLLFLQDDTQLVRQVDEQDVACLDHFFTNHLNAAFVNPVFLKGHRRSSIEKQVKLQEKCQGYFHNISEKLKPRPVSMYYCDVVIAHVSRLRKINWQFADSETANADNARQHFSKMLQMAHPFVMHIPEVPIFRGKKTTVGSRLANRLVGADIKTFGFMSAAEVDKMRTRSLASSPPFAEDFLQTHNKAVAKPYRYNAVSTRLFTRVLHKIEYSITRKSQT